MLINSLVSVIQNHRAESALQALKKMSVPQAKVLRAGSKHSISARELVVGDVVLLEAGDFVPADGRLLEVQNLQVEEGALTGESKPVEKMTEKIERDIGIGDQKNKVFSSGLVVRGRGRFVVTAIASNTELGKIAQLLETAQAKQTPLQQKLEKFGKQLSFAILGLCLLIFAIQTLRIVIDAQIFDIQKELFNAFMFAVAVAVAAIPEALSSVVTLVLSVGTSKMAKHHAVMRNLPAVETLGSTGVICTDKTGTLTQNKMTVVDTFLPSNTDKNQLLTGLSAANDKFLLQAMVLCNDASFAADGKALGDPTEVALVAYSYQLEQKMKDLRGKAPRLSELSFDSERKLMSTLNQMETERVIFVKGGPDVIFSRCSHVFVDGGEKLFTEKWRRKLQEKNEYFSQKALRVLAFAYKSVSSSKQHLEPSDEENLVLIGLAAMIDPPREAVYESIAQAKKAGIRTVMITGDHKTTACAIAKEIGLMNSTDKAVSGQELDKMTDEQLTDELSQISVYARVSPKHKIRIVQAWQRKKQVTAMTGDGVNDAPALKEANIGIAMGSGTDVAKEASSMILTDDNFVSIMQAVEIGRVVYDNIKKSIAYLFSGNLGAMLAIIFALVVGWANPFTALQLLFINLVNDSIPAIALGLEKAEPDVMSKHPRQLREGIFANGLMKIILIRGSLIGLVAIFAQFIGLSESAEMGVAMAFTTLILARTFQTFSAKSNTHSIFRQGLTSNKYIFGAVIFCLTLYGVTTLPVMREIFSIPSNFGWRQWFIALSLALFSTVLMELLKILQVGFGRSRFRMILSKK